MYRVTYSLLLAALLLVSGPSTRAAHDMETLPESATPFRLVVLEAPGCIYCGIFRRDVLPSYMASPRARQVPIRFLDLNDEQADKLKLDVPVDIVPTVVLLKGDAEVGRIPGYVGPENFFHSVNYLMSRLDVAGGRNP